MEFFEQKFYDEEEALEISTGLSNEHWFGMEHNIWGESSLPPKCFTV